MRHIQNEKGIALVMALLFALIGLAISSAMLFMLTQGSLMSGAFKTYRSADEAGLGGAALVTEMIKARGTAPGLTVLPFGLDACLTQKLSISRGVASPLGWTSCTVANRLSMDPLAEDDTNCPLDPGSGKHICADMTADLPGPAGSSFRTYTKIVDTVEGNTDVGGLVGSGELGGAGVVASTSGQVTPPAIPYMYRVEVQTQNTANPSERSRYSVLYAH